MILLLWAAVGVTPPPPPPVVLGGGGSPSTQVWPFGRGRTSFEDGKPVVEQPPAPVPARVVPPRPVPNALKTAPPGYLESIPKLSQMGVEGFQLHHDILDHVALL